MIVRALDRAPTLENNRLSRALLVLIRVVQSIAPILANGPPPGVIHRRDNDWSTPLMTVAHPPTVTLLIAHMRRPHVRKVRHTLVAVLNQGLSVEAIYLSTNLVSF